MTDLPFSSFQVQNAFPECKVEPEALGLGTFKVAYLVTEPDIRVLKIIFFTAVPDDQEINDFMDSSQDEEFTARIQREISAMASLRSPFIVPIVEGPEIRKIGGSSYVCYWEPYYSGGTLDDKIKAGDHSIELGIVIAKALLQASSDMWHTNRIVHRDIKPGNIAFTANGDPILLDLGIALHSKLSSLTNSMFVSPRTDLYSAPEQWVTRGVTNIDFRTDQYAIGLTCFEAAVGKRPFYREGDTPGELLNKMHSFEPSQLNDSIKDEKLLKVLGRLLSPQQSRRYRNPEMAIKELL